jgi:hypothetical protein
MTNKLLMPSFYALYDSEHGLYQLLYASDGHPVQDANHQAIFISFEDVEMRGIPTQNDEV